MLTYFTESEEIKMDVQVGPQEEVEAKVDDSECCGKCDNPIECAKKDPNTVPVGCCTNKQTGVKEFYVDAADVAKLAELNEMTMLEALDEIIDVNEGSGMCADNIVVVMSEGTEMYERNLERNGAACVHFNESMSEAGEPDIEMDVQVGPNSEEISVSEDPQEANPVDAVKRQYDSVVVAKDGDKFFMDVEDVQKCAELNCESVIDTINGIIDVHEGFDMNTGNIVLIVSEGTNASTYDDLCESGAIIVFESNGNTEQARRKKMIKDLARTLRNFLVDQGCMRVDVSSFYIGGENKNFVTGSGKTVLLGISSKAANRAALVQAGSGNVYTSASDEDKAVAGIEAAIKCIKDNKDELISEIEDKFDGYKVSSVRVQTGRLGVTNVAITFGEADN